MMFVMHGKGVSEGLDREGWWVDGCFGKSSFLYSEDRVIFKGMENRIKGQNQAQFIINVV